MKRFQKYAAVGAAGAMVGGIVMIVTGAFGQGTTAGTLSLQPGANLDVTCPNALSNAAKTGNSETVQCAADTTTTTVAPTTTTKVQATTTTTKVAATTTTTKVAATTTTTKAPSGWSCTTSATMGHCPFPADSYITGSGLSNPYVDQNIWSPSSGYSQTLNANSPKDWQVVAKAPAGGTAVIAYPNTGVDLSGAVDSYSQITSSFTESMNANSQTSGWAMFDLWYNNWADEVMIQYDFANNGDCTPVASATFGGSNGVPVQTWHLCNFGGGTLDWKLGPSEAKKQTEQTGTVDLLAMSKWLETHGYLPAASTWTAISDGWEICSTGGKSETFQLTNYSLTVK